jgi:hypothetical protein
MCTRGKANIHNHPENYIAQGGCMIKKREEKHGTQDLHKRGRFIIQTVSSIGGYIFIGPFSPPRNAHNSSSDRNLSDNCVTLRLICHV